MFAPKNCLVLASCLLLAAGPAYANPASKARSSSTKSNTAGQSLLAWVGKQLPEFSLRSVACLKKHEKDGKEVLLSVLGDVAKCFDETRGSVMYTTECMLRNGVPHLINLLGEVHKVTGCVFRNKQDSRLCMSVTDNRDQTCPFAVGF